MVTELCTSTAWAWAPQPGRHCPQTLPPSARPVQLSCVDFRCSGMCCAVASPSGMRTPLILSSGIQGLACSGHTCYSSLISVFLAACLPPVFHSLNSCALPHSQASAPRSPHLGGCVPPRRSHQFLTVCESLPHACWKRTAPSLD
ncbi:hypothetical protein HJG60_010036 [Phyllostomus discolor]|uniref:Uncharacterized protein n=1 Tax=Phyllostomus discolor TaxID=89673 RepID=A0A834AW00_9CHIR|nr:hypothetical protein HJG60_010036 [Phyllostomus discolor]